MKSNKDEERGGVEGGNPATPQVSDVHRGGEDNASMQSSLKDVRSLGAPDVEFKPSRRLYVAFATLAVITLMVALDGTSLSVALPVSLPSPFTVIFPRRY